MTVLALEPVGGIAGDMMLAALLHLGAPRAALDDGLLALAEASGAFDLRGTRVVAEPVEVSGIRALRVDVRVPPEVRDREPHHRPWRAIRDLLGRARLPERARELALLAFTRLAEAEGRVHGVTAEEVEFHEVGAVDAIVDVVGSALLVSALAPARIVCLPPPSGGGTARAAHGPIPIPGPAVLEVMRGRALRPSGPGERTTPTGAALVAAWTESAESLPELSVQAVGYGAGTRRWEDAPNLLRAVLGVAVRGQPGGGAGWVLEANLDDLSPQLVATALEAVLAAGAADAWIAPVTMKKGRPGHLLGAVVPEAARAAVEEALFRETSTLGVRAHRVERSVLDREVVEVATRYGPVRVKVGRRGGAVLNAAPEFEDCRLRAKEHGVAVKEVLAAAIAAWRSAG
ncbi:MAG TPA: nickel pincer cofactor biosynthesis protein LarC [Myxococcales bacterium]|nr:nickel pincer cofactor biosynthesis protein LarC [Myxococcales bacterium]